eukprot:CAMPEP_0176136542 /NCGR_PEP_ID=MMETSP0120_2-20121206/69295_1 /TAXON_ID=160619 /ORGANISM="Kryptoperidinium foliaceum, Strain CCMP 1326" /LENGTH=191 /DNA_ID=CAMNT_0017472323 /DNA_START=44 /DNA_END=616 /DNA_ORIENTATION=+
MAPARGAAKGSSLIDAGGTETQKTVVSEIFRSAISTDAELTLGSLLKAYDWTITKHGIRSSDLAGIQIYRALLQWGRQQGGGGGADARQDLPQESPKPLGSANRGAPQNSLLPSPPPSLQSTVAACVGGSQGQAPLRSEATQPLSQTPLSGRPRTLSLSDSAPIRLSGPTGGGKACAGVAMPAAAPAPVPS